MRVEKSLVRTDSLKGKRRERNYISNSVHPSDHMSMPKEYESPSMISGALGMEVSRGYMERGEDGELGDRRGWRTWQGVRTE